MTRRSNRASQRLRKGRGDVAGNRQLVRATPHGSSWRAWIAPVERDPTFDNLVTEVEGPIRPPRSSAARKSVTAGSKEARARSSGFEACVNGDLDQQSSSCGITVTAMRKQLVTRWWDAQETAVSGSAPAPRVDDRASGRKHEAV
jgi:hypothetical protein